MDLQRQISERLPNANTVKTFSLGLVAVILVSVVGVQIASLWFAGSDQRECFALRKLVGDIAGTLERSPDRKIKCEKVRDLVVRSQEKLVQAPWFASLNAAFKFSEDLEKFVEKAVEEYCVNGYITHGDVAKALRAEIERRCG
jgi:hypothetical protein